MNATERAALLQRNERFTEMRLAVDDRTLEILERRRRTATVHRRGWLVRRMLLAADVIRASLERDTALPVQTPPTASSVSCFRLRW